MIWRHQLGRGVSDDEAATRRRRGDKAMTKRLRTSRTHYVGFGGVPYCPLLYPSRARCCVKNHVNALRAK
jgi:hypothetical protein